MQAVVLAGGEGRRLRPLTANRPKPMLPAANQPLLDHVIQAVADAGIEEIVLVVGYRRDRIQNYCGDGDRWGVDITYAVQPQQRGTGDAVLQAAPHVEDSFIVVNGDRIIDPQAISNVRDRHADTGDPAVAITEVDTPSEYGVVSLEGGFITHIEERPAPELAASKLINAGVYAFDPTIFAAIEETAHRGELGLPDAINAIAEDRPVHAVPYGGRWLDVSYPWDLLTVNETLLGEAPPPDAETATVHDTAVVADHTVLGADARVQPQATVLGGSAVGANVTVGPNTLLSNAIVLSDATVMGGTIVRDCIIGANTTVGPGTVVEGGRADVPLAGVVHEDVRFGGVLGDNTAVGGNVTVRPGTILGNDVTVDGGAVISDQIEAGTVISRG